MNCDNSFVVRIWLLGIAVGMGCVGLLKTIDGAGYSFRKLIRIADHIIVRVFGLTMDASKKLFYRMVIILSTLACDISGV